MTDLKPQHSPTDAHDAESPIGPPPVAADGGDARSSPDEDHPEADGNLTYDQRADAAAEAVRQVALHLGLAEQ